LQAAHQFRDSNSTAMMQFQNGQALSVWKQKIKAEKIVRNAIPL
jgi:hypothetical protein